MSALETLLERHPLPTWRPTAAIVMALLTGGLGWASLAQVERIAIAPGVVAPHGQVRVVQHLEGGIVEQLNVRNGDAVTAGQPLLTIDLGEEGLNADEIQIRVDALTLERARLLAETLQVDLAMPDAAAARQPDLARAERATYTSRRREYESGQAVLRDQRTQRELAVESILARMKAGRSKLEPLSQQRDIAQALAERQLMKRTEALSLERQYQELLGELADLEVALPLAQSALAEARERELFERNRFRNAANDRLRAVEIELARQSELLGRAQRQVRRTVVESPIDGVVTSLSVNTIGGVVRPGEPILEVVPSRERLVIEAKLSPDDVGHVTAGQPARVKLSTYDFFRYGALDGDVARIAADATADENGVYYFQMVIQPDQDHLAVGDQQYPLSAGMAAQVEVKLGSRSVIEYLISPVLKLRDEAFRER